MSESQPTPIRLYTTDGVNASSDLPALQGGKCLACGYVFFPMQAYGCERCGSQKVEPSPLKGRGRLLASADVFMPAGSHRDAPFTVGSIKMDDGAVVRAILDVPAGARLMPNSIMETRLVPENRPNRGEHDLRFVLVGRTGS